MALTDAPAVPAEGPDRLRLAFVAHPDSIHTRRWVGWFAAAGHEVAIVDPVGIDVDPGLAEGIRVLRIPARSGDRPLGGWLARRGWLRSELTTFRPDVVHAHYLARFAWSAAAAGVRPLVVTPWGSDLLQVRRTRIRTRILNRLALRRADLVTVSSAGMRAAAIAAGARQERIVLIHHGVDTRRFAPGAPSAALVARVDAGGAPVVLSPRTIRPLYHHEIAVEAIAELRRRGGSVPLLVLTDSGADPGTVAGLRARADSLGVAHRLRILEGVRHDDLPDLYRLADVVLSLPETDSFAVTLLEAMACGRPLVATDLPAVGPVLRTLHSLAPQLLVPVGDVRRTADAIQRAIGLPGEQKAGLAAAFRGHVTNTAEYEGNMRMMEARYRALRAPVHR